MVLWHNIGLSQAKEKLGTFFKVKERSGTEFYY